MYTEFPRERALKSDFQLRNSDESYNPDLTSKMAAPRINDSCLENTPASGGHRRVHDEMMQFLHVSEEASQRHHKQNLAQRRSSQQAFEALMTRFLEKMCCLTFL